MDDDAAQRPRKSARKRKQTHKAQSQLEPVLQPQQQQPEEEEEEEQEYQQRLRRQQQNMNQKQKRARLVISNNKSQGNQPENMPTVAACTSSKLAAITEIVEAQQELIDRLMSAREHAGIVEFPDREMELHEQDKLSKKLCALEPEHLATACSFAQLTVAAPGDDGDYTLDLPKQSRRVLWRLWDYAHKNARTPAQRRAAAKRKLLEREAVLGKDVTAASNSLDSDSSDDTLSDDSDSE
eukprot:COSAG02_NODE_3253_length_7088_cov_3.212620_4_plen_239_part_00